MTTQPLPEPITTPVDIDGMIFQRAALLTLEVAALLAILMIGAQLRLANVAENPAWYSDEATHIDIAHHLMQGRVRYMAVQDSTLLFARPPLFHLLLASCYRLAGNADPMLVLRTLTGSLGMLSVLLLYALVRRTGDMPLALIAAGVLAVYPQSVLYSRFGFSYNLLAPLVLLALLGLSAFAETKRARWLALAAAAVGLGTVAEIAGFTLLVPLVLVVFLARRPLHLLWSVPLALAPFAVYALVMMTRAPEVFLFDLRFTVARLGEHPGLDWQLANLAHNYQTLLAQDVWMPAGFLGMFLLKPASLRWVSLLVLWIPFAAAGRVFALYNLSAYYLIPLLPLIALGAAALIRYGVAQGAATIRTALGAWGIPALIRETVAVGGAVVVIALLVGVPLSASVMPQFTAVTSGFPTAIDAFLVNTRDARAAADYINTHTEPHDIVIVSPVVGWLFDTNVADFQMTAAATGRATPHLPAGIPASRWAFPMAYTEARFIVVDNLWYNWGVVHVPGLDAILRDVETWQRVFEAGDLRVYASPRR